MIIIPDVHGRLFWESPVKESLRKEHILFLGDYLDPYEYEGITPDEAFLVFKEIVNLKREHPDDVTLLLGNHDLHYLYEGLMGGRYDLERAEQIKALILGNAGLFRMAHVKIIGGTRILFTHAGVRLGWLARHQGILDVSRFADIAACLNHLWLDPSRRNDLLKALCDIPYSRWGASRYGSPVWNDVDDLTDGKEELPGYCQIFGHSQQESDPVITDYHACLDCRRAFRLTEEGELEPYGEIAK